MVEEHHVRSDGLCAVSNRRGGRGGGLGSGVWRGGARYGSLTRSDEFLGGRTLVQPGDVVVVRLARGERCGGACCRLKVKNREASVRDGVSSPASPASTCRDGRRCNTPQRVQLELLPRKTGSNDPLNNGL